MAGQGFQGSDLGVMVDTEATTRLKANRRRKRANLFVKGPLPFPWLTAAARCHPRGVEVLLVIRMLSDIQGASQVALPNGLLAEMGVTRETKRRALEALEDAGLVRVNRCPGRLPRVALVPRNCSPEGQLARPV